MHFQRKIAAPKENPLKELLCVFPRRGIFLPFQVVGTVCGRVMQRFVFRADHIVKVFIFQRSFADPWCFVGTVSSNNFVFGIMQADYKDCLRIQIPLIEQRDLRRLQLDFRIQCPRFGRTYCYEFLEFFFALNMHGFVDWRKVNERHLPLFR